MKSNLNKALKYCSLNIRCKSEVLQKINSWNLEKEESDQIINFLEIHSFFLEDGLYLDRFLENLSTVKGYSKIQLKQKLQKKGISLKLINNKIDKYFLENDSFELQKYITRNLKKFEAKPREKAIRYLISRGFKYNSIIQAFKDNNL